MTIEYRYDTLADVADYFKNLAKTRRESAAGSITKRRAEILRVEAATWESAAEVLRKCKLKTQD